MKITKDVRKYAAEQGIPDASSVIGLTIGCDPKRLWPGGQ